MEAVKINEASTWTWEEGHDSIGSGWNEGVNESTWLRVYDLDGEPLKDTFDEDVFVGYHSFKVSDDSLAGRIFNSSIHGAGSVHLYSKIGDRLVKSLVHDPKTKNTGEAFAGQAVRNEMAIEKRAKLDQDFAGFDFQWHHETKLRLAPILGLRHGKTIKHPHLASI
jgi:hypothetical protein